MADHKPDDANNVLKVFRFGWMMAEYHGRFSELTSEKLNVSPRQNLIPREALLLTHERSDGELAAQAEQIVIALAHECGWDGIEIEAGVLPDGITGAVSEVLVQYRKAILSTTDTATRKETLTQFVALLRAWDARIQDKLATTSLNQAGAYQLGRGLAEIWWAGSRDLTGRKEYKWEWLLGEERYNALDLRLGRLNEYFGSDITVAMRSSLKAWADIARDRKKRRRPGTMTGLYKQVQVWRDLLLNDYNPENLVSYRTFLENHRRVNVSLLLKSFLGEIVATVLCIGLLTVGITMIVNAGKNPSTASTVVSAGLSLLGVFGVTAATLTAKAKSAVDDLNTHLRETLRRELLAYQITVLPARKQVGAAEEKEHGRMREGMRKLGRLVPRAMGSRTERGRAQQPA